MKKSIIVLMLGLGGIVYAQDTITLQENIEIDILKLRDISYKLESTVLNDSLNLVEKTAFYPTTNALLRDRLKYISANDEAASAYIDFTTAVDTVKVKSIYIEDKLQHGLVVEDNVGDDFAVVYYSNYIPVDRYITNVDYHFYSAFISELEKDNTLRDQLDNLEEGSSLPNKQRLVEGQWTMWDSSLTKSQVLIEGLVTPATVYTQLDEVKERMIWKITDQHNVLHYLLLQREKGIITVYEQSFVKKGDKLVSSYLNTARMINVGFDKKRITAKTEKGKTISDIYFETYGKMNWKKNNQYIFDYKRKSDKKSVRARVILDASIQVDSIFFDFLVALANNPELFRRDIQLKDFSFEQVMTQKILQLDSSIKALHTLDQ